MLDGMGQGGESVSGLRVTSAHCTWPHARGNPDQTNNRSTCKGSGDRLTKMRSPGERGTPDELPPFSQCLLKADKT